MGSIPALGRVNFLPVRQVWPEEASSFTPCLLENEQHLADLLGIDLDRRTWDTREQLRQAIVTWIETKYHRRRRQDRLGRLTPIEYEAKITTETGHAA